MVVEVRKNRVKTAEMSMVYRGNRRNTGWSQEVCAEKSGERI